MHKKNKTKRLFVLAFHLLALFFIMRCTSSQQFQTIEKKNGTQTDECIMKDEICKEAADFQIQYETMTEEQKKDMVPVLNSYIENCEDARKRCEKSNR